MTEPEPPRELAPDELPDRPSETDPVDRGEPPPAPRVVSARTTYRVAGVDHERRRQVVVARGLSDLAAARRAGLAAVGTTPMKRGRRVNVQRYVVYERTTETLSDGSTRRGDWRPIGEHGTVKIEGGVRTGRLRTSRSHVEERDRKRGDS